MATITTIQGIQSLQTETQLLNLDQLLTMLYGFVALHDDNTEVAHYQPQQSDSQRQQQATETLHRAASFAQEFAHRTDYPAQTLVEEVNALVGAGKCAEARRFIQRHVSAIGKQLT